MNQDDRAAILDLFERLRAVEARSGPREPEADALIHTAVARQPGAPYYMAQTIIVQNQALSEAQRRIEELESEPQDRGLFSGLFSSGAPARSAVPPAGRRGGPPLAARGDGFLAGAAQTALGVAGGVLLGNIVADAMFGGDEAEAAEADASPDQDMADPGGDFDVGDF